jgi:hypothetical protein
LIALALLSAMPLAAAITGTVTNRTTGKPQAATTITLYQFGQGGMEPVTQTKTDTQGRFAFSQDPSGQGPSMLRVEVDRITYNHLMPPGTPTMGIAMDVYNASKQPGPAKVGKHLILFQPDGNGQMTVSETYLVENPGETTWADPVGGTLHFYLPAAANGQVEISAAAPDGLPVPVPTGKTSQPEVFQAKFECKPGETRFDLNYTVPYTAGQPYAGRIVSGDDNTYLVAPNGVQLEGAGLQDLGAESRTGSHIYGLSATSYRVRLTGAVTAAPAAAPADAASGDASAAGQQDNGPPIEVVMPRIYRKAAFIMGFALGILALGFALLYRAPASKETHERGRG